jgi:hypothetical protein
MLTRCGRARAIALLSGLLVVLASLGLAGTAQASASATLTPSATSVPNGGAITFRYTVPSSDASPYNVVAVIPADQPPVSGSVTGYASASGASGSVTFIVSSIGGIGSYNAFLANEETDDIYALTSFTVTKGTVHQAPAFDMLAGQGTLAGPYGRHRP